MNKEAISREDAEKLTFRQFHDMQPLQRASLRKQYPDIYIMFMVAETGTRKEGLWTIDN